MSDVIQRVSELRGKRDQLQEILSEKKKTLKRLERRGKNIELTQALLQETARETQDGLIVHLEDMGQMAMDLCFPGEYTFKVQFELKNGRSVCEMFLEDPDGYRYDPLSANGGGLTDILSLALRVSVWSLKPTDSVMILDEPFKWPDKVLKQLTGEFLQEIAKRLKLQLIIITHDEKMMEIADRTFMVKKNRKGVSKVKVDGV